MIDINQDSRFFPLMAASLAVMRVMGNNDHLYFRSLPTYWSNLDTNALQYIESALYVEYMDLVIRRWIVLS